MSRVSFKGYLALFTPWFRGVTLSRRTETTSQLYKLSVYVHVHMGIFLGIYRTATSKKTKIELGISRGFLDFLDPDRPGNPDGRPGGGPRPHNYFVGATHTLPFALSVQHGE